MMVRHLFSRYAGDYDNYSIIQQLVSRHLVNGVRSRPRRILELGSGTGQVYNHIDWEVDYYKAVDFSDAMCTLHPRGENIEIVCENFDDILFLKSVSNSKYDMVLSSSALQWSKNLPYVAHVLSAITPKVNAALFTSNTFKTIQEITGISSPILSLDIIRSAFEENFDCQFEIINYHLEFRSKDKMFEYIKKSGVSGDKDRLSFKDAKKLYCLYNKNYLEFEVVFVKACS